MSTNIQSLQSSNDETWCLALRHIYLFCMRFLFFFLLFCIEFIFSFSIDKKKEKRKNNKATIWHFEIEKDALDGRCGGFDNHIDETDRHYIKFSATFSWTSDIIDRWSWWSRSFQSKTEEKLFFVLFFFIFRLFSIERRWTIVWETSANSDNTFITSELRVIQRNYEIKFKNLKKKLIEVFFSNEKFYAKRRPQQRIRMTFSNIFFTLIFFSFRSKGESAMRRFEKCLCFTLASLNYYEDLLHKFSILIVYFPLASGGSMSKTKENSEFLFTSSI